MMTWEAPIWLYLWLAGMAGGACFATVLINAFSGGTHRSLVRLGLYVGVPLAVIGVLLLVVDLGMPLRFWHLMLLFKPLSAMSMGTWILFFYVAAGIIAIILWWGQSVMNLPKTGSLPAIANVMTWAAFIFSILLMAYTGVLLASSNQPMWSGTILLPSLFLASAVSSGLGVVVLIAALTRLKGISAQTLTRLAEADAIVIVIEALLLVAFALWLGNPQLSGAAQSLAILTSGPLAWPFWVGVALLALVIPLALDLVFWGKERGALMAGMVSAGCVVLGGVFLRAVIVIGGQI